MLTLWQEESDRIPDGLALVNGFFYGHLIDAILNDHPDLQEILAIRLLGSLDFFSRKTNLSLADRRELFPDDHPSAFISPNENWPGDLPDSISQKSEDDQTNRRGPEGVALGVVGKNEAGWQRIQFAWGATGG